MELFLRMVSQVVERLTPCMFGVVSVLNISHNKLSHLPSGIGELKSLKALYVSSNLLHDIPEEIGSATSLIKFDCSSNQLKELPCSLGNCKDLSDLKELMERESMI
ncbi:hypothetical protein L2E82_34224 [Cichorium intybus]|uniref:Uncharacterized protein n=1 Tax=Cichorium intybus TaxID=13427 RepID=A0ACB9BLT1_CICIN|nr:hypothetical protein L2E82_34224 [Cichorium intybus]